MDIKQNIGELKVSLVETGVDVGPAIYIARTLGTDIDTVVKFFIFILIFVFDPLAVMFVISYNVILVDRAEADELSGRRSDSDITTKKRNWWEVYGEKEEPISEIETKSDDTESEKTVDKKPIWQQSHGKFTKVQKKP